MKVLKTLTASEIWALLLNQQLKQQLNESWIEIVDVYVAHRNSDLTEGRGHEVPFMVCDSAFLAERVAENQSTQGCDGTVREMKALLVHAPSSDGSTFTFAFIQDCHHAGPWELMLTSEEEKLAAKEDLIKRALWKLSPAEREALGLK